MAIIKQFDKRSGITYVYESHAFYDKEKKQSRAKRTLIGRLDPETNEIIPTDGRNKRRRDQDTQKPGPQDVLIQKLTEENLQLKAQVEALTRELRNLKGSHT